MGTPTSVIGQGDRDQQQPRHGNIDSAQKRDRGKMSVKLDSRGQPRGERRSDKGGRGGRIRGGYGYGGYGGRGGTNESQVRYNMSKIQMAMADLKSVQHVHDVFMLHDQVMLTVSRARHVVGIPLKCTPTCHWKTMTMVRKRRFCGWKMMRAPLVN